MPAPAEPRVEISEVRSTGTPLQRLGVRRAVVCALAFCAVLSLVFEAIDFDPTFGTRRFHVALETADALVLIVLAAVLLGRFRSDGSLRNLVLAAGVVVIAVKNGLFAANAMFLDDTVAGDHPIVWGTAVSGVLGASLLAAAGLLTDRRIDNSPRVAGVVLVLGSFAVVALALAMNAVHDWLPTAFPTVPDDDEFTDLDVLSGHPVKIGIDLGTSVGYAVAAAAFARLADRYRDDFVGWMAVGSAIASCAFIYYAMIPSRFTELLYGGEILWLCAIIAFLYGAISEISNLESALVRSAVRAERRRVARDLHDGVVQELAYIATHGGRLLEQVGGTPYEASVRRISDAASRALDESRGAIAALNRELDEPLHQAVGLAAKDVADRADVRLDLRIDPSVETPVEWRDALIRIAREAVGNAARHGGASSVVLELGGKPVVLTVSDDGRGFDPGAPRSAHSFGLRSMRERSESLGGTFEVLSTEDAGTTVRVVVAPSS
ncbi:sensor histidine kinase [Nocardioides bizhenqiangii]|uniref:Histidine kinase n=1 Tax=Nocardioides bizhenqiangii TaxID=3095076 RepID=A0ABZ0ZVM9_9ACTN|nr:MULTISPECIES: ATP-binding protein [unclassified Nocardioides]MDZ5622524.1 histidine kinase [Nocardioides sp. HM23]WQQ28317.1 histidine kinase [Nocardioides sp. HM61]